jgi:hypothetical protein
MAIASQPGMETSLPIPERAITRASATTRNARKSLPFCKLSRYGEQQMQTNEPARMHLAWSPTPLALIAASCIGIARAIATGGAVLVIVPSLALAIGLALAGLAHRANEPLHAAVVRQRPAARDWQTR